MTHLSLQTAAKADDQLVKSLDISTKLKTSATFGECLNNECTQSLVG